MGRSMQAVALVAIAIVIGTGCIASKAPIIDARASAYVATRLGALHFAAEADKAATAWNWSFGDGQSSPNQSVNHTYAVLGLFAPFVNATIDGRVFQTNLTPILVENIEPKLSATITVNSNFLVADGAAIQFNVTRLDSLSFVDESADSDGTVTGREWDFGDGKESFEAHATHTYGSLGSFAPMLTVTDNDGGLNRSLVATIRVIDVPPRVPTILVGSAHQFTPLEFSAEASDPDGQIVAYSWDFGDGNGSSLATPTHTYSQMGNYQVSLVVTDDNGSTSRASMPVSVGKPTYKYSINPSVSVPGAMDATLAAFKYWSGRGYDISVVTNQSDANRVISFTKEWGGDTLGMCLNAALDPSKQPCEVIVGLGDSNCNGQWTRYDDNSLYVISRHEVGHSLGLLHAQEPNDPMYPTTAVQYAAPCSIATGSSVEISPGVTSSYGFTIENHPISVSYAFQENDGGSLTACIATQSQCVSTAQAGASGRDTITLQPGTYLLLIRCDQSYQYNVCLASYAVRGMHV